MSSRSPADRDQGALSDDDAGRLLARASELDAARGARSEVADLRAAALDAGISAQAFDAALAEMQQASPAHTAEVGRRPRPRRWTLALAAGAATLIGLGALVVARQPTPAAVPTVEEAILLRCLTPGEAAELLRPLLQDPSSRIVLRAAQAPRVLTIRATPERLRRAKAALAAYEGDGSRSCAR